MKARCSASDGVCDVVTGALVDSFQDAERRRDGFDVPVGGGLFQSADDCSTFDDAVAGLRRLPGLAFSLPAESHAVLSVESPTLRRVWAYRRRAEGLVSFRSSGS